MAPTSRALNSVRGFVGPSLTRHSRSKIMVRGHRRQSDLFKRLANSAGSGRRRCSARPVPLPAPPREHGDRLARGPPAAQQVLGHLDRRPVLLPSDDRGLAVVQGTGGAAERAVDGLADQVVREGEGVTLADQHLRGVASWIDGSSSGARVHSSRASVSTVNRPRSTHPAPSIRRASTESPFIVCSTIVMKLDGSWSPTTVAHAVADQQLAGPVQGPHQLLQLPSRRQRDERRRPIQLSTQPASPRPDPEPRAYTPAADLPERTIAAGASRQPWVILPGCSRIDVSSAGPSARSQLASLLVLSAC
jgi:hypothetical protein